MKCAIVVGASSGIGREVAKLLLAGGWRLGVAARREDKLNELKAVSPAMVEVCRIDVTAADAADRLLALAEKLGSVDLFVYCSGVGKQNPGLDRDVELSTVGVNVTGFTRMVDTMFAYMAERKGGHIAVISSIAGTKGLGVAPSYSATKAYQNTYIQALEQLSNMRGLNIRFTDIRPGFVDTDLLSGNQHYPFMMKPEKVACAIARAINYRRRKVVINRKYALLTFLWSMIPDYIWERLDIHTKAKNPDKL